MAAQVSRGRRQPGRGWRAALHLYAVATVAMEERAHDECDRAATRGIQTADQDADGSARRRRPQCYFGRCSHPDRSDYGRSMGGARSAERSLSHLTSPPDKLPSKSPESVIWEIPPD